MTPYCYAARLDALLHDADGPLLDALIEAGDAFGGLSTAGFAHDLREHEDRATGAALEAAARGELWTRPGEGIHSAISRAGRAAVDEWQRQAERALARVGGVEGIVREVALGHLRNRENANV